jgi:Zn-dependent peptidase ImmA (M78 family)
MDKKEIVSLAKCIREVFNTNDPFNISKLLGIKVEYREYSRAVKGYYRKVFDDVYIVINKNYSLKEQKIICAHELGHALLHTDVAQHIIDEYYNGGDISVLEHEANIFALSLLLDEELDIEISSMSNYLIQNIFNI